MGTKSNKIRAAIVVLVVIAGGFFIAQLYADREADRRIAKMLTQLPPGTSVRYQSAGYDLLSGEIKLGNIAVKSTVAGSARIRGLTVIKYDTGNDVPHYAELRVRGFEMRIEDATLETKAWMQRLGYRKITLDVDYAYRYQPGLRALTIKEFRISGKRIGTVRIAARVGNVTRIDVASIAQLAGVALQTVVKSGRLSFEDGSLVGRLIRDQARRAGQSEKAYRVALISGIDNDMRQTKSASLRRQLLHVRAFVEKPGRITLEMLPRRPVPVLLVAGVRDTGLLQRILGITVTATPLKAKKTK